MIIENEKNIGVDKSVQLKLISDNSDKGITKNDNTDSKENGKFLIIEGNRIHYETKMVNIFDIRYYPRNPRVASILENFREGATQEDIEREMWEKLEHVTHPLYRDIRDNGGLQEEIIVSEDNEVLEGNSRLCAYRHLFRNDADKEKWKYIPAKVIKTRLNIKLINSLLCQQHIKGKADWDAHEKAAYFARMNEKDGMEFWEIAQRTGIRVNDVKNHIKAYELMRSEGEANIKRYSHYHELIKIGPKLSDIKKRDPSIEKKIVKYIKEGKFSDARKVRNIGDILRNKEARKIFDATGDNFDEALVIAKKGNPSIDDNFYKKLDEMVEFLRKAKIQKLSYEIEEDENKKNKIERFLKETIKFGRNLGLEDSISTKIKDKDDSENILSYVDIHKE